MIDSEDRLLIESVEQSAVELLRRREVVTERFFNNDASAHCASRLGKLCHNRTEQRRRDGEIVRRLLHWAKLLAQRMKRCRILVVAVNVMQQTNQLFESGGINSAVFFKALLRSCLKLSELPPSFRHADDRHLQVSAFYHRLQCRKNLLISKVSRSAEKNQRIRMGNVHCFLLTWQIFPGVRRSQSAWLKAVGPGNRLHHAKRTFGTRRSSTLALARLRQWLP